MDVASNLLLNLLVILIAFIFHQYWWESKPTSRFVKKYGIGITSSVAILLCMNFSLYNYNGVQFDLRPIPLWFGTIYGGPFTGLILTLITVGVSLNKGGPLVFIAIIYTVSFFFITLLTSKIYLSLNTVKKMVLGLAINVSFSLLVLLSFLLIDLKYFHLTFWAEFVFIHAVGMMIVSLSLEMLKSNYKMRMKLVQAEKMETISHIAASVNHEVNNPLTSVKGIIQLLKDEPSISEPKKQELFNIALDEINQLDHIVKEYLVFAKPYPKVIKEYNVADCINKAINEVGILVPREGAISLEILTNIQLSGDPDLLIHSMINLLKYSLEGREDTEFVIKISLTNQGDLCLIHILDNGTPPSDEDRFHLEGEPFFSHNTNGTGLELMSAYRIIENMEGKLSISSHHVKGKDIRVLLPT